MTETILNKSDFCRLMIKIRKRDFQYTGVILERFWSNHATYYRLNLFFKNCFGDFADTDVLGTFRALTAVAQLPGCYKLEKHSDGYIKLIR